MTDANPNRPGKSLPFTHWSDDPPNSERLMSRSTHTPESLADAGVRLLLGTLIDNAGVVRVKSIPIGKLPSAVRSGTGLSPAFAVMCVDDHVVNTAVYGGPAGDLRLRPDMAAAVIIDANVGLAWAPLEQFDQELEPVEICQRGTLKNHQSAAAAAGFEYLMAFEIEFTLFNAGGSEPAHSGPGYGLRPFLALEKFSLDLLDALGSASIEVETLHPEYGPGQMEISLAPRSPVAAVDQYVLARLIIARTAQANNLGVSFAPVTIPDAIGNGCHIHFSAKANGINLFGGGDEVFELTTTGAQMIAGVLAHLQDTAGLFTPSVISYERLVPGHWSGAYACWGLENRETAVRFVRGSVTSRPGAANVEIKAIDASSNPYLVAAALIGLSQLGVTEHLPLPEPVGEAPDDLSPAIRAERGIVRLPTELAVALDRFEQSSALRKILGTNLVDCLVAVRRYEVQTHGQHPINDRIAFLRDKY